MNKFNIVPSSQKYKSAPDVDLEISVSIDSSSQELVEYDRSSTISLAQVYDEERQECTVFRPTFKVNYIYANTLTGTTDYVPFRDNLYYYRATESKATGVWLGFPQYFEFDFVRPDIRDGHFIYRSDSATTYNWMSYVTYPSQNIYDTKMSYTSEDVGKLDWIVSDGIPFYISNNFSDGLQVIQFNCVLKHGLTVGEFVQLSFGYAGENLFQVYTLGDGMYQSEETVFSIVNIGYTGNTFESGKTGTLKRVVNPDNIIETTSKYYVRKHKVLTKLEDIVITKNGFEKNVFLEETKVEISTITPNNVTRVSRKTGSDSYSFTLANDINIGGLVDNQKKPLTELYLTLIFRGYSGYFNLPNNGIGLKRGWEFNLNPRNSSWWDSNNVDSNSNIPTESYTNTSGVTKTFFYNQELNIGDELDGDLCEWNDFEQLERVVSVCVHKIRYNSNVFQISNLSNTNTLGYTYQPHNKMQIRVFSDYVETGSRESVENIPSYAFYSSSDGEFRWRDLYPYGFLDTNNVGVNYPYLNTAHYPYQGVIFRLIPDGINYDTETTSLFGGTARAINAIKPITDPCE